MKTIFKLLPHEAETAIKSALNEAEMIAGRNLTDEQKSTIIRFLLDDVKTKFNWLTVPYLNQAIRNGLSSDFKYLDYKTICKWFWEFKNLPEMRLKIILNTPLTPTNVAIYSRLLLDGYFKINTYKRYYDHEEKANIDIERVWQAQRKIVLDQFAEFKMQGAEYIYSPNQYLKNGN